MSESLNLAKMTSLQALVIDTHILFSRH